MRVESQLDICNTFPLQPPFVSFAFDGEQCSLADAKLQAQMMHLAAQAMAQLSELQERLSD